VSRQSHPGGPFERKTFLLGALEWTPPRFVPAAQSTTTPAGTSWSPDLLGWSEVPYLLPQQRQHLDTMCCDCQGTWELDDEVLINEPT
jgi:hypothetical protein